MFLVSFRFPPAAEMSKSNLSFVRYAFLTLKSDTRFPKRHAVFLIKNSRRFLASGSLCGQQHPILKRIAQQHALLCFLDHSAALSEPIDNLANFAGLG